MMLVGPKFGEWLAGVLHLSFLWARIWPVLRWAVSGAFIVVAVESHVFPGSECEAAICPYVERRGFCGCGLACTLLCTGIYFQRFANFNRTYGALGGAIALMTWLYWSSFVILLGAEINGQVLQASGDGTLPLKQAPPEKVKPKAVPDIAA